MERTRTVLFWRVRVALALFLVIAVAVIWTTNTFLTERYTASSKSRAEVRQALFVGNLLSELQRSSVVTLLLSRDPKLIGALRGGDFSQASRHIIDIKEEIDAASIFLLDESGRTVAATDRNLIGSMRRSEPYFVSALRSNDTEFNTVVSENGAIGFVHSRRIENGGDLIGAIVVGSNLRRFERAWSSVFEAALVTDSTGRIILATEARWRGLSEQEASLAGLAPTAISRAFRAVSDWTLISASGIGGTLMRIERRIPFHGWRMVSYTTYADVRERVNTVLALEIMLFAILLAGGSYFLSRRAIARSALLQRESAELRRLNESLLREIDERERAERNLEVAEQTIVQSSKLAALGEMSASVSHELNQPLAAMKTYLAGTKLLIRRQRLPEAVSNVDRIDDLIERMNTITRQLRLYARKEDDAIGPTDVKHSVSSATALTEPLLRDRNVRLTCDLPPDPVMVMAGRIRLDQVLVNLIRNAVDATKNVGNPSIEIVLSVDRSVKVSVSDNGPGIEDLESLFEPFYTTKAPGEGTGLGLAISSGIVKELQGRLTARNHPSGGAVFEVRLPLIPNAEAAE